ncbi:MAG: twin-arginine translocation signal domain-containing protein [Planctomycetaceae bacterium]|nr:twin-arginine translocation signal domain-containing protein [Planctomycetaceae bacterium]MCA9111921.1 twin-arginine translocation signal domain-containing protein [Planctomycetaceae bacterium]
MLISRRNLMKNCALAGAAVTATLTSVASAEDEVKGISDADLEQIITGLGLKPTKNEQRYDFGFKAALNEEEWELSMSAVLSQDGNTVWVMAWLDELPKSSAEVPRTALLRLLAANDQMGNGKFFAYIAGNRRFVLQRVIETQGLTKDEFKITLQDLGATVVETYPQWAVANWNDGSTATQVSSGDSKAGQTQTRSAANESKFQEPVRR